MRCHDGNLRLICLVDSSSLSAASASTFLVQIHAPVLEKDGSVWSQHPPLPTGLVTSKIRAHAGVDNLFVFLLTFDYFQVPLEHQGRVLTWGIVGAILMRGVMIAFGVAVVTRFKWITLVFAGILLVSSYKLLAEGDDDDHDLSQNSLVRWVGLTKRTGQLEPSSRRRVRYGISYPRAPITGNQ